ncbi:MAG: 30S ribosomal protein S27ae [Candidatus Aenigmatarchaeota archaeon]
MKHKPVKQSEYYKIEGNKVTRLRRTCPRCGDSWLAYHDNRYYCGKCGYTELKLNKT